MTRSLRTSAAAFRPSSPGAAQDVRPDPRQNLLSGRGRGRAAVRAAHGFVRAPGLIEGYDPFAIRAQMPERWSLWVRKHFRRAEEAAVAFGVTHQCAKYWFEGLHKPSGDTLLIAADLWGAEFLAHMMGEA
ncbi:hypothetical protein V8J36_05410 [Frigidibacter sp. MR17.14]|uniref:hypothetical protein n=1 Tax=Frigidibacter sp. MR17.14 TaxID=3126509 RepID=UPI0030130315